MNHPMPPAGSIPNINPKYALLPKGKTLIRVTAKLRKDLVLNTYGPSGRFDHHPAGPPKLHSQHGIVYLAETLESAFAEIFFKKAIVGGYNGSGTIKDRVLQNIEIVQDVMLLDLCESGVIDAGMRQSLLDEYQERTVTQAWARYITEDSFNQFPHVEGLVWPSAKNGQKIYAVYQMAKDKIQLTGSSSLRSDPILTQVMDIALRYKILIEDL